MQEKPPAAKHFAIYPKAASVPDIFMDLLLADTAEDGLVGKGNLNRPLSFKRLIPCLFFSAVFVIESKIPCPV